MEDIDKKLDELLALAKKTKEYSIKCKEAARSYEIDVAEKLLEECREIYEKMAMKLEELAKAENLSNNQKPSMKHVYVNDQVALATSILEAAETFLEIYKRLGKTE